MPKMDWHRSLEHPTVVVLYREPARWRFAVWCEDGSVADGALESPPAMSPEEVMESLRRRVELFAHKPLSITWAPSPDKPNWWTGRVTEPQP